MFYFTCDHGLRQTVRQTDAVVSVAIERTAESRRNVVVAASTAVRWECCVSVVQTQVTRCQSVACSSSLPFHRRRRRRRRRRLVVVVVVVVVSTFCRSTDWRTAAEREHMAHRFRGAQLGRTRTITTTHCRSVKLASEQLRNIAQEINYDSSMPAFPLLHSHSTETSSLSATWLIYLLIYLQPTSRRISVISFLFPVHI